MCGRVVQKMPLNEIRVLSRRLNSVPNAAPTYNGAPTDSLPVVHLDPGRRRAFLCPFGLATRKRRQFGVGYAAGLGKAWWSSHRPRCQ